MKMVIHNAGMVQDGKITKCDLLIRDGQIGEILPAGNGKAADEEIDAEGLYLSHGFIDIHVHGGGGHDFMDGTEAAWDGVRMLHMRHGTTGMIATTLAATMEEMEGAARMFNRCRNRAGGTKLLGLHMEGPYLSPAQSGAQDPAYIRKPAAQEYRRLIEMCPGIVRWTVAPELENADEMGDYLKAHGILPSIGHSNSVYTEVVNAITHGYRHITHLYSAMSTVTREGGFRRGGIIESAYVLPELTSEIIADGCHLPPELLRLAYRGIGPDRLALVTDAMRAAGQTEGESILGSLSKGQKVIIEDGVAKMPDRKAFAGSICTADRLVRNMIQLAGASLPDAVKMMTETPAKIMGMSERTGRIESGRSADVILFDDEIHIRLVVMNGVIQYSEL